MTVRTRIAPSPTGSPHIGTAYVALFNYAFTRSQGGRFLLRIEDTDQARSSRESEQAILEALHWLGLDWDEGPDKGGAFGPYRQSERTAIYREHAAKLVELDLAYPCFCTPDRLGELRRQQESSRESKVGYDGLCARLSPVEAAARVKAGERHVIRLRLPESGECVMRDRFRGEIRIPWETLDHQVLVKSDGFPTYHLANVVDDHLMQISHVIRGEEWISSTPKHLLLYRSFGWQPPEFAHLPLLRNPDKSKLSKRKNPTSILYYREAGVLPEALLNYLGLISYSMPDGQEMFTLKDMTDAFDLDRVSLGGPIFDLAKLRAFNARHIRALAPNALLDRIKDWRLNEATWRRIVPLAQPRLNLLSDLVPMAAFLFEDRPDYQATSLIEAFGGDGARAARLARIAQWELEKITAWTCDSIQKVFSVIADKEGARLKDLMAPFYVVISGRMVSLPVFDSMEILGRDLTLRRIHYAIEALDAAGFAIKSKDLKTLVFAYESAYGPRL